MKRLLTAGLLTVALSGSAHALNIMLDAESLKDALGNAMPLGGLVILTTATNGIFSGPTPAAFTSGGELELKRWDLSGSFGLAGILSDQTGDLRFSGNWNENDPLRLYWFPSLTVAATAPGQGTSYGSYSDTVGLDGSAKWFTPGQADTISLRFYTSDASFLASGGSNPASAGRANQTVVPEPATASLGLLGAALLGLRRHRRRA